MTIYTILFRWNGLWGPLGIETIQVFSFVMLIQSWNGLWGPLGIETYKLHQPRIAPVRLEWLVGPVRD